MTLWGGRTITLIPLGTNVTHQTIFKCCKFTHLTTVTSITGNNGTELSFWTIVASIRAFQWLSSSFRTCLTGDTFINCTNITRWTRISTRTFWLTFAIILERIYTKKMLIITFAIKNWNNWLKMVVKT